MSPRDERLWIGAWLALALPLARILTLDHRLSVDSDRYLDAARAILDEQDFGAQRYPPGFPLLLAGTDLLGLPAWTITTGTAILLCALVWWLAVRLGGPVAGVAAGVFLGLSDFTGEAGVLLMSDTPAAAAVAGALVAAVYGRWRLAGLLIAGSAWIRLPHAVFALAAGRARMTVAATAGLLPLALFNLTVYGSLSTYASNQADWRLAYLYEGLYLDNTATPYGNAYFYTAALNGKWGLLVPLLTLAAGAELWHRRAERIAWMAAGIIVLNVAVYLFYFYQSARFVLPAAATIIALSSAWVGRMAGRADEEGFHRSAAASPLSDQSTT